MSDRDEVERAARALLDVMGPVVVTLPIDSLIRDKMRALRSALARPRDEGAEEAKAAFYEAAARHFTIEFDCPVTEDGPPQEWYDDHDVAAREAGQALRRLREAKARAPAAPKCGTGGGATVRLTTARDPESGALLTDIAPPRPVTPDDSKGAAFYKAALGYAEADENMVAHYVASHGGDENAYSRKAVELLRAVDKARDAMGVAYRALRDERGGHDEPDPRGVDREAIEAARRGGGRGE